MRLLSSFGVSAKTGEREEEEVRSMTGFVREGRVSHRGIYRFTEKILHRTDGSVVRSYFLTQDTMLGNPVVRGVAIEKGVIKQVVGFEEVERKQFLYELLYGLITSKPDLNRITINNKHNKREEVIDMEREKQPPPRFHPKTIIPEIPEGMELHKFYGEPILLPARAEGELMYGNSPFSMRQVETLQRLVAERNHAIEKEAMRISIYE